MATANDITDASYRKCGIKSPSSTEDADALIALNNMIGSWSIDFVIPVVTRESFDLIAGQAEYTIASGDAYDFNTVRPISINNVYLKDSDGHSYSVHLLSAKDYNLIGSKTLEGRPKSLYFVPEYPTAKIIFNKEADKVYTAYFEFNKHLTEIAAIGDTVSLPNEFKEALVYNLAIRLAEDNSIELPPSVATLAVITYTRIARIGSINKMPPTARFEMTGGGLYNIVTDE
jgi:hypothetical protein